MFPGCPVLVQHGRVVRTNVRGTPGLSGSEGTCAQLEDYKVGASQQAELRRGQVAGSRVLQGPTCQPGDSPLDRLLQSAQPPPV
ncbi:rCG48223 [Rattus norvegicus]|uniref:RCG48223 n=1 Tax=Rattus norvegicus TaxID=10116 RepID=A6HY79_RAT|nr:rCG48223 [Rattus norvegicus]